MTSKGILTVALSAIGAAVVFAQAEPPRLPPVAPNAPAPSRQSACDPGYAALIATCKTPPPGRGGRAGGPARGAGPGRGPQAPQGVREYAVTEIPGVIAAGQKWTFQWQQAGNNGDGIIGLNDGTLLLAQNDSSAVLKLDKNGKTSVAYADTHTGGALSMSKKGDLFIVERGLNARIEQLAPKRRVLADKYNGDPIDCIGGVINDLTADSKGGVYFTMGGVFYASASGAITKYGDTQPNGIILSADEKTLYVTNGPTLAAASAGLHPHTPAHKHASLAGSTRLGTVHSAPKVHFGCLDSRDFCQEPHCKARGSKDTELQHTI